MSAIVHDFGASVRRLREAHAWSQERLAEHAGLNRTYVGEIERGAAIASIVTAEKLARALGVDIGDLLAGGAVHAAVLPGIPLSP
ncbi:MULTISPECIES: helix-turn-helix transcriptional regulator [unclassified Paraburkholderia]|uniref:helix-turn-helix domain-containing protein n=1 Tax=unclassified Paraburkholderia TaxID=2615204 RepID=UPI002AB7787B|nr:MULTISPECIES: helix-turn-helix transcriptional regulator [unclassified Paraburkholderia]